MKGDYNMKPTFAKLGLKMNNNIKTILINGQEIEVKQYLPINEKLDLIGSVINQATDENNFSNPVKLDVFTKLEIIFRYTNLTFTDKQKEDLIKLYDILESNNIFTIVINAMDADEYNNIINGIKDCSSSIYNYRHSVLGILDSISNDYDATKMNMDNLMQVLDKPESVGLVKEILDKIG